MRKRHLEILGYRVVQVRVYTSTLHYLRMLHLFYWIVSKVCDIKTKKCAQTVKLPLC